MPHKTRTALQLEMYKEHRRNVKEAVKKIDDQPSMLHAEKYVRKGDLSATQRRLDQVEKANRVLVENINRIYRTKGEVECHETFTYKKSNYKNRLISNLKIERDNQLFHEILSLSASKYKKSDQLESFKKVQEEMIRCTEYPEFYATDMIDPLEKWSICPSDENENPENIKSIPSKRVKCFFDLEIIGERKLGRMFIEIYKDYVPIAGENFLHFVKGENGEGYKNTILYRIKPGFGLLGGDVENRNGASTVTAYGHPFSHENHLLRFAGPGVVAAFTLFPGLNFCQYLITFKALPFLQNQFVVIGRIIKNLRTLEMIEEFGTASGVPRKTITVTNCGIWQGKKTQMK